VRLIVDGALLAAGGVCPARAVRQPRKIQRSGVWASVEGRVLIYIHKERMLDAVAERYPAQHYVMVDDKLRI